MPSPIIRSYLLQDTVDHTAQQIFNLNPGGWTDVSKVPIHLYTSLCTLWTGASGGVNRIANYNKSIVARSGQGLDTANNSIIIQSYICESSNATGEEGDLVQDDAIGAENALVRIMFKTQASPPPAIAQRTKDSELRVRLLLDCNLRRLGSKPNSIPIDNTDDRSIDDSYTLFLLNWLGDSNDQNSIEMVANYACSYVRCFGNTIIP